MSPTEWMAPCLECIEAALMDMWFAAPVAPAEQAEACPPGAWCVSVAFSGLEDGRMWLAATPETAADLAASLLGLEPGRAAGEAQSFETLTELANVICGSLLSRVHPEAHWTIQAPERADAAAAAPAEWLAIPLETGPLWLAWLCPYAG